MSVKLRFGSPSDGYLVHRSRSFTGFSSLTGRQRASFGRNSLRPKATTGGKSPRMHLSLGSGAGAFWPLQPEEVDRVFKALRKGLKEYLEGHQAEMDFLSSQQRESKRNSRLAYLYDLEKEIRALERYIRRLEFQISKVEELYESYWVQWRLLQGAVNMKRAFSVSPSSRASRDSLLELSRNHRHSLQVMSVMEEELEILLGELHIKMKGLIGFARLCLGDQYEVVVRLGRQRWRIRGRIQSDDTQSWDEEEVVFLPHIHHHLEIKVTEAKGLGWLLVGMVTCASADFFVARSQMMVVEVTELGTLKLQLEVTWSPFDSSDRMRPSSRKTSVYSWTAPSTPYCIHSMMQDPDSSSLVSRGRPIRGGVSLVSYLSDPSHAVATPTPRRPEPLQSQADSQLPLQPGHQSGGEARPRCPSWTCPRRRRRRGGSGAPLSIPREVGSLSPQVQNSRPPQTEHRPGPPPEFSCRTPQKCRSYSPTPQPPRPPPTLPPAAAPPPSVARRGALAVRLGTLMAELEETLKNRSGSEKELRGLDQQVLHLATILKNDLSLLRGSSSEEEDVEEVLGSFDFLSHDDDASCLGSVRLEMQRVSRSQLSSVCTSLRRLGPSTSEERLGVAPLTSGNWSLDQALETHLDLCCILLQTIRTTDFSPTRTELLQEMSLQADVLRSISCLLLEKHGGVSAADVLPEAQRTREVLLFWEECVADGGAPFCCVSSRFCRTLKKRFTHKVEAKQRGQADRVFSQLLQQLQTSCRSVPSPRQVCSPERVTIFQLWSYLKRWSLQELGEHITHGSPEKYILSALRSPKRRRTLNKMRGRSMVELLPLGCTLQTLAALQVDSNHKVCKAAASCLCRAAACKAFRTQALVYYTESLKSTDVQIQQGSCMALKCLMATESVDHIADLWSSGDEDLCSAAREAVLSFGKKGLPAFQRMDQLSTEMQEEFYQNQETETTFL
ncbi:LOW QUALITY PROTEIN: RIPOR family member 3 [Cyclopterus lumpus]|uniref:LOW QUALITY PROTEIN: RIPOR family member 3 n=1 Tax=Cyclopterus lumpus TaxID=8103 RepID=UPI001486B3EE|nr:LOW QUALITY PROTEIN: RIPOR family member 3 [Cyclopterus lumpus]